MTRAEIRARFPATGRLRYFNAAASGLLPDTVVARMGEVAGRQSREGIFSFPEEMRLVDGTRAAAARLLGCEAADVAFVASVADGLARIADGIDWRAGDEVVLCDLEYPSNVYPWAAQQRRGARLRWVRGEAGRVPVERFVEAIGPRTRVVAVSHVQFASGYRIDLDVLGRACQERGAMLVVDAIQSLGVVPLEVARPPVGALVADGRKWLLGPAGTGVLYVAPRWAATLRPGALGARSVRQPDELLQYRERIGGDGRLDLDALLRSDAGRFECGYPGVIGIAGLGAALELGERIGRPRIVERVARLARVWVERVEAEGWTGFGPRADGERAGIVSFEVPVAPEPLWRRLNREGISLSLRDGRLRAAPHVYNTEVEIDQVVDRIQRLVHGRG